MAQSYADVVAAQIEVITPLLEGFFDEEDSLFSMMEKIQTHTQSGRAIRIPIELRPGGKMRAANFDNASLGTGSGPVFDYASMTPVDATFNLAWSLKSKFTTDSAAKAVVDTVQRTIASGVREAKIHVDKHLQTTGTGILATVTSNASAPTFAVAGNGFGARLLRFNDPVGIYDSTQSNYYGELYVTGIDYPNETVTLSASSVGGHTIAATDKICVAGLTATPPTWTFGLPLTVAEVKEHCIGETLFGVN